ncbi:hypothetical protein FSP39_000430 [Pinctada imbricata]|uniref:Tyrosine-protein kinase BAZ1B n=1 Tax=Pinctada imbricata TaxID=66713 RepID=A0AA88YFY9_PINIB|nr:hypothetical protein FSP39_000430 [Pinctada imbricata]
MTHEEAWQSEKMVMKSLKSQFPKWCEKPVLELVHHSTLPLETLVDQGWLKLQQVLCLGEKVVLKVKAAGKTIRGVIVKIDRAGIEVNPTSNCTGSPSSDKENASEDGNSPKKWSPPKLLPYKYSFRLEGEDKIINAVPAADLQREEKAPSKELIRLFIRAYAIRAGQNAAGPWIVDEDKVKEFNLPSKFADFLLSPVKMSDVAKKAEEEKAKKRKSRSSLDSSSSKRAKIDKTSDKGKDNKKQITLTGSPLKKSSSSCTSPQQKSSTSCTSPQQKSPLSHYKIPKKNSPVKVNGEEVEVISCESSSDEDEPLAKLKDDDKSLAKLKESHKVKTPSSSSKLNTSSSSKPTKDGKKLEKTKDETKEKVKKIKKDKDGKVIGKKVKKDKDGKIIEKKVKKDKDSKDKKKEQKKEKKKEEKKKVKKENSDSEEEKPLSNLKNKGMKQMTLFELSGKKGMKTPEKKKSNLTTLKTPEKGLKTPEKSRIASPPKTPAIVSKLMRAFKQKDDNRTKTLASQAAKLLTATQRKKLPSEVKDLVHRKFEFLEKKRKLASMSEAEKAEYMQQKRMEKKKQLQEKQRELKKKFEDQDLELKPLPQPKLVPTPDGLPNELFGDIAMVTEFVNSYSGLLMPDDEYPIYTEALMKAISSGKEGFAYLGRVLVVLLQTLLQDQISEDYQEIKMQLSEIPVNQYTSSELVRLCLRRQDVDDQASDASGEEEEEEEVSDEIIQLLENQELYQLDPVQKVVILKGLCLRIMGTYSVQDYMEEQQQQAIELWKEKTKQLKEKNDELKKVKQEKKEMAEKGKAKSSEKAEEKESEDKEKDTGDKSTSILITHFYGKSVDTGSDSSKPPTPTPGDDGGGEGDDLASMVKMRRSVRAKALEEKDKLEKEKQIRKEKEYEINRKEREKEIFEKKFEEGIALAKSVLRQVPIGTDRNHNRYWIFSSTTPGLYMEKGWASPDIDYSAGCKVKKKKDEEEGGENTTDPQEDPEKTLPTPGQNLWFTYESMKEMDSVIENLHSQGVREGKLRAELIKRYADIKSAIFKASRKEKELRDSDGDKDMEGSFKKELLETEIRLRHGGLGGVTDFPEWEKRLETAEDFKTLGKCLIDTQEHVLDKFMEGVMGRKQKKVVTVEHPGDEEEDQEGGKSVPVGVTRWQEAVENASTFSRLHVLLGVLDACIKWEKSSENAKCKICRKKGNEDALLLCDECNQAFHMHCLRPALYEVPKGDWLCPACMPTQRRKVRELPPRYTERNSDSSEDDDDGDDGDIQHEDKCCECQGEEEELILCAKCPAAYHLECHDPPLRRAPRGPWVCFYCKNGLKRKTRSRTNRNQALKQKKAPPKRKRYEESESEESSSEEETEQEDESGSETEEDGDDEDDRKGTKAPREKPPAKSQRTSQKQTSARRGRPAKTDNSGGGKKVGRGRNSGGRGVQDNTVTEGRVSSRRAPSDLSVCEQIIANTMKHKKCWPFLNPVNKKEVPDYYEIIKHPLDFQIVKDRLQCLVYGSVDEVLDDVRLIFNNAETYNQEGSDILECLQEVEAYFSAEMMNHLPAFPYSRSLVNGNDEGSPHTVGKKRARR